ncbi:MAG TPA: RyR domain-containing protein [Candidatus Krumholzibacteria bacterium]|nr:RyR domain-containing protein [Candidatus Krumholzibacteria bacterium]
MTDRIDTSAVEVPASLIPLRERLAAHIHAVWAEGRRRGGWTWGPRRDDEALTHPGLVPYDDLSESEKDYDRNTALETLKAVLALGYRLESPQTDDPEAGTDSMT